MEALFSVQLELGLEVERLVRNYRKDSTQRKDAKYLLAREGSILSLWKKFEANHKELSKHKEQYSEVDYFHSNYFGQVEALVDTTTKDIRGLLESLEANQNDSTSQPEVHQTQRRDDLFHSSVRCENIMLKTLRHLLERTEERLKVENPKEFNQSQLQAIKAQWEGIRSKHQQILETFDIPADYDISNYVETESWVEKVQIELMTALAQPINSPQASIKLPRIQLPTFDGNYLAWQEFHDLFSQLIDQNAIGPAQKLWFLKTNLTGEAEALIRHLPVCDSNYQPAWHLIKERYHNKRLLVNAVLGKLMSQPCINNDSSEAIKSLHDTTQECVRALQALDVQVDQWDPILVFLLVKKLDKATHVLFEQTLQMPREIPTLRHLLQFLEQRFQSLEALGSKLPRATPKSAVKKLSLTTANSSDVCCTLCGGGHTINHCDTFLAMDLQARKGCITKRQLCFNCLKSGHSVKTCVSRSCVKCGKRHHTLIHFEKVQQKPHKAPGQVLTLHQSSDNESSYVFLGTALVDLLDENGDNVTARALIDSGSQLSFISNKLCKKLQLRTTPHIQDIMGIGNSLRQSTKRVNLNIKSKTSSFNTQFEAFLLKEITSKHPERFVDTSEWPIPKNIPLADPNFNVPQEIEILLGAELFCSLISSGKISLGKQLPSLQNTVLGWMILGKVKSNPNRAQLCGITRNLDEQLQKFWEIEELTSENPSVVAVNEECEQYFQSTTTRTAKGRYIVRLPFVKSPSALGQSKQIAIQRLNSLQKRFDRHPTLRKEYSEFIENYLKLGHMEPVTNINESKPHYYLPHHCVLRPESTTTKLRVVFDGSAKTSSNLSLNDILQTGPTLQQNLFDILLRFRYQKYVITADIEKMYRQVLIHEADRNFQLILWRDRVGGEIKTYRLKTVTYGTRSAPYLAVRCLNQLANDEGSSFPTAAATIHRDFYVDDLLTGVDKLEEAIELQKDLTSLLERGGFRLHKWCSNSAHLLNSIPPTNRATEVDITKVETENVIKTLGISWMPATDEFNIKVSIKTSTHSITKRTVLSEMSQLFDPLGLVNPVIVLAKIFMQQLWELGIDWDTPLSDDLQQKWGMYQAQLPLLNTLKIPRRIRNFRAFFFFFLHGFADASERAYGACIYLRSEDWGRDATTFLVCSKSRVAPLKKRTIARLELCAAQLLVNLMQQVKSALEAPISKTFFWTDSAIVLQWIASPPSKFTTFVANRVAMIQSRTKDGIWQHIESGQNPADIISRGMLPSQLMSAKLWFEGPKLLRHPIRVQSSIPDPIDSIMIPEVRKVKFVLAAASINTDLVHMVRHNNNFRRLQEVIAFIIRFTKNCRLEKHERASGKPTPCERDIALKIIVRAMQAEDFKPELTQLKKDGIVANNSRLQALAPFLDNDQIIRVGGRITQSELPFKSKHAMVIAHTNLLSKLLFQHLHERYLHAGPQTLLYISRQTFWCINGRALANTTVKQCIRCMRTKPRLLNQIMGDLPAERIQQSRPFLHIGVDFCGPIQIHYKLRGKRPTKAYIAVFICFSTKAIHLELVSDLTSAAFIGSLKRFIARRGRPAKIFCDNATNFIGAQAELAELTKVFHQQSGQDTITSFCSNEDIEWCHIPPRSPHFGGLWEAAVKSAKYHLKRLLGCASLTYEELNTVICEVEAILNSRPLTPISSNANDLQPLTPGHFLIGQPLSALADPAIQMENLSLTTRWKLVKSLRAEFWRRWSKEYLQELQTRYKWQKPKPDISKGMLVLLKDDNLPPLQWRMGRILETIAGPDNHIRVVIVKTSTGEFRRAIHTVCPLPCNISTPEQLSEEPQEIKVASRKPKIAPVSSNYASLVKHQPAKRKPEEESQPRIKKGRSMLLQTLLCVVLVFPILEQATGSAVNAPIQIIPFKNNPGIFFEEVGKVKLTHNTWKIVTYYNLSGYWTEYNGLAKCIIKLVEVCGAQDTLLNLTNYCNAVVSQFQHLHLEIEERNELLYQHATKRLRRKRAPLNIVGTAAHLLFGILDEEFAAKYEADIHKIKRNENYLLELLKNQTSIIEGTLNTFKKSTDQIHQQFKSIDDQIQHLQATTLKNEEINQIFNSVALQTSMLITHLANMQNTLLQIVTNTYHGKINPLLLNASQLHKQIQVMRDHLPANQIVPVSEKSPLSIYNTAIVRTRTTHNNVIFDIQIPLLSSDQYQLLKIHPVPTKFQNGSIQIQPSTNYLAVTLHRDKYYPLSEHDRSRCHHFDMDYLICNQRHPVYTIQSTANKCEISLLTYQVNVSSSCNVQSVTAKDHWIQLEESNSWIFSIKNKQTLNIVCNHSIYNERIEGSGILKLGSGCVLTQGAIIITSHSEFLNKMNFTLAPMMNLSEYAELQGYATTNSNIHTHLDWSFNQSTFDTLRSRLQQQMAAELPERISSHDTHNYIVNYVSLLLILAISAYCIRQAVIVIKTKRKTKKTSDVEILAREFKVAEDVQSTIPRDQSK